MSVIQQILNELNALSALIDDEQLQEMCKLLIECRNKHNKVFLAGAGRSGCIVKGFANRLMHLGFSCFVVGDITTPPIKKGDILFVLSASGNTNSLVSMVSKAKELEIMILTMTLQKEGKIGKNADAFILLPGTTRLQNKEQYSSIQPIGSSFEQLAWLCCDALIMIMKNRLGLSNEDLIQNHANLE